MTVRSLYGSMFSNPAKKVFRHVLAAKLDGEKSGNEGCATYLISRRRLKILPDS
jgi:hypothetical protein